MCRIYFEQNGEKLLRTIGMSKSEFARRMGIRKQNVNVLFKTKNLDTIRKASEVLGVPLGLLIGYTEEVDINGLLPRNIESDVSFQDAFWHLIDNQAGTLKGVFHRPDLGIIDLTWGDKECGVCNILLKQIENRDFSSLTQMIESITETIESGVVLQKSNSEISLRKDSIIVSLKSDLNGPQEPTMERNWSVMTYRIL